VGLQYVVCVAAAVETLVNTGVFNFTLVHISVTLGANFGAAGGAPAPGVVGAFGAPGILLPGVGGVAGGGTVGSVYRFPSTSCPSIIDFPRSSTWTGGALTGGVAPAVAPGAAGAVPGGVIGITLASFLA
jgi:hypothetical protein